MREIQTRRENLKFQVSHISNVILLIFFLFYDVVKFLLQAGKKDLYNKPFLIKLKDDSQMPVFPPFEIQIDST